MRTFKMNVLFTLTLLLTAFTAIAQEPSSTLEFENAETANEVVQNYVKALQNGDVATMNAQLATNAMIYGLGGGLDSLNVMQHKEYFTNSMENYKHSITQDLYLPIKVTNNWNEGEWILSWGTNTAKNKQTGGEITIPYHIATMVENGKITRMHYFYDILNVRTSQGYKIVAPE